MVNIRIIVRLEACVFFDCLQMCVELDETVFSLKQRICDIYNHMTVDCIEVVYCGCAMDDFDSISSYGVFKGSTVHVHIKIKTEEPTPPKKFTEVMLIKLSAAFRALSSNPLYEKTLNEFREPGGFKNVIMTPGLNKDPVALTFLQHSELLAQLGIFSLAKVAYESHPALAEAVFQIDENVLEKDLEVILLINIIALYYFILNIINDMLCGRSTMLRMTFQTAIPLTTLHMYY